MLLLSCLLFVSAGYHLLFLMQRQQIRKEMKALLLHNAVRRQELTVLQLTPQEYKTALVEASEIRLGSELYDVLEVKHNGDLLTLTCLPDKKEKALLEAYIRGTQKNNDGQHPMQQLVKLMTAPCEPAAMWQLQMPESNLTAAPAFFIAALSDADREILLPPPRA